MDKGFGAINRRQTNVVPACWFRYNILQEDGTIGKNHIGYMINMELL